MVNNGDNYLGKTVKAKGPFSYYQESDGRDFFAVIISDATALQVRNLAFLGHKYLLTPYDLNI